MGIGSRNLFIVFIAAFVAIVMFASKSDIALAADFNVTVDVSVTSLTEITVTPAVLNWSLITPGTAGGVKTVDVRNTGSTNITNLYAFMSTINNETVRPYGSSNPAAYSAGGVVAFRNESTSTYHWAGRMEWNWTEAIASTDQSAIGAGSRRSEGFFRNASVSFYWIAGNGTTNVSVTNDTCNNTNAIFAIEDDPDNGTTESRTPVATSITREGGDTEWSYFRVSRATSFLNGACVAVNASCQKIYVYKFDKRTGAFNATTCTNSNFINAGPLAPNDVEALQSDVWIPKGLPQGNLNRATWTFVAS